MPELPVIAGRTNGSTLVGARVWLLIAAAAAVAGAVVLLWQTASAQDDSTDEPLKPATWMALSNFHLDQNRSTTNYIAQRFRTGDNATGYWVTDIKLRLLATADKDTTVTIRTDDEGLPGEVLVVLTAPGALAANATNTFTDPENDPPHTPHLVLDLHR